MDKLMISKRFKEVLQDLKNKKKLSGYEELASNYDPGSKKEKSFISEMANGRTIPNAEVVDYLGRQYNVSREYIYEGTGGMYTESTKEVPDKKKEEITISDLTLLIETNRLLAEAHKIFAEANLKLAMTNERLSLMSNPIAVSPAQIPEVFAATIRNLQELITDVAIGKRFASKQEVNALLGRSDISTFQKAP